MLIDIYNNFQNGFKNKKIIIIRGTASSGKSVLAAKLGNALHELFMIFPVEDLVFFHMLPTKYLVTGEEHARGFSVQRDENKDIISVKSSEWGTLLYLTYISTLEKYTQQGLNIICDGNLVDESSLKILLQYVPDDYEIYIFSLNVPLSILEARERKRKNVRAPGFAKHQFEKMKNSTYLDDLTVHILNEYTKCSQSVSKIMHYLLHHKGNKKQEIEKRFKIT